MNCFVIYSYHQFLAAFATMRRRSDLGSFAFVAWNYSSLELLNVQVGDGASVATGTTDDDNSNLFATQSTLY